MSQQSAQSRFEKVTNLANDDVILPSICPVKTDMQRAMYIATSSSELPPTSLLDTINCPAECSGPIEVVRKPYSLLRVFGSTVLKCSQSE